MYLAIDLGGTKTLVSLLDAQGVVKNSIKFPTSQNYNLFLEELKANIETITEGINIEKTCIAIPGRVDRENGIILKLGNLDWGENIPIIKDVKSRTNLDIIIENDANLAGLSEAILVKDRYKKALYITISTGIGGVYVIDGKIDQNTIDAEIGHMIFEYEGKIAEWEDMASGKWLVAKFGKRASDLEDENAWRIFCDNVALGIINTTNVLMPDVIIIGGGVGSHLHKFKQYLDEAIIKLNPGFTKIPDIIQAQKPEEAVIYGCYELIKQ